MNTAIASDFTHSSHRHLQYQEQDSPQTVRQGLAEYYTQMDDLFDPEALDGESRELFQRHDVAHVVFGCDVSVRQEARTDAWTIFGTDLSMRRFLGYVRLPESRQIIRDLGFWRTVKISLAAIPDFFAIIRRTRRMHKKWPWDDHEGYLDRPLHAVRKEFGIAVMP